MKRPLLIAVVVAGAALSMVVFAGYETFRDIKHFSVVAPNASSTTPSSLEVNTQAPRAYGEVKIRIGETAVFPDVRITPLEVTEDSRCPIDVQCIQAGTVRVRLETVSGMGTSTDILTLGRSLTTEAEEVSFIGVSPESVAGQEISRENYLFTFSVTKRAVVQSCYVGGCSSEICSDRPDIASNCLYRPQFACYRAATCERQSSGECGWTMTDTLRMCLAENQ